MKSFLIPCFSTVWVVFYALSGSAQATLNMQKWDIFSFQSQHAHGSTLTELPNEQILATWFQGSGERQADDVAIMGARFTPETQEWSEPFLMADVPDFPDINPVLFIDPTDQLWLVWYTVMANQWETSLLKYRISTDYLSPGSPQWHWQEVLHMKPGGKTERGIQAEDPFATAMMEKFAQYRTYLDTTGAFEQDMGQDIDLREEYDKRVEELRILAYGEDWMARGRGPDSSGQIVRMPMGYPRFRRLGWQTRNRPLFLENGRMLLPLYSDGFDFSIMAITNDLGQTWQFSEPIVGIGPVQGRDGTLHFTYSYHLREGEEQRKTIRYARVQIK